MAAQSKKSGGSKKYGRNRAKCAKAGPVRSKRPKKKGSNQTRPNLPPEQDIKAVRAVRFVDTTNGTLALGGIHRDGEFSLANGIRVK